MIAEAAESVRNSITSLRSTLVESYPPDLADQGLAAALDNLVQDCSDDGLTISLDTGGLDRPLPAPVSALLYLDDHGCITSPTVTRYRRCP